MNRTEKPKQIFLIVCWKYRLVYVSFFSLYSCSSISEIQQVKFRTDLLNEVILWQYWTCLENIANDSFLVYIREQVIKVLLSLHYQHTFVLIIQEIFHFVFSFLRITFFWCFVRRILVKQDVFEDFSIFLFIYHEFIGQDYAHIEYKLDCSFEVRILPLYFLIIFWIICWLSYELDKHFSLLLNTTSTEKQCSALQLI